MTEGCPRWGNRIKYFEWEQPQKAHSGLGPADCHAHLEELDDRAQRKEQEDLLRKLLSLAERFSKPVIIHARGAWQKCLGLLLEQGIARAVFHWFSGPPDVLKDILNHGYLISATPAARYSEKHRSAIHHAPLEKILLETDAPVPTREGVRNLQTY